MTKPNSPTPASNEQLGTFIDYYLSLTVPPKYAVLLNGPWGKAPAEENCYELSGRSTTKRPERNATMSTSEKCSHRPRSKVISPSKIGAEVGKAV